ncbi:uncharacterized protein Tco025E_01250 [Trypanosoma conorhini]|uniref:Uncharacterized protein n=1 Tax=Trypanosoma conorhini TaxID=83891 RepID=A0A3R7LKE1_9TRYP|nr:uncharacterized protein Tco025E_01250 [Trypanosoma conorhini]RNF26389.1 hypothetical protein Tco025E_01250 [Trypanosoma conorhini]
MSAAEAPRPPGVPAGYRDRLVHFFQRHDATKLRRVDALLEKYAGKEERLLHALAQTYASRPPRPEASPADPPARGPQEECPPPAEGHGECRAAAAALPDADQPPPSTAPAERDDYKRRLTSFFLLYDSAKVPHVDTLLRKYRGREAGVMESLVRRFGPEPSNLKEPPSAEEAEEVSVVAPISDAALAARLRRFYAHHDAKELQGSHVDELVHNFREAPEALFEELTQVYGPEPAEAEAVPQPQPQLSAEAKGEALRPAESSATLAPDGSVTDVGPTLSGSTVLSAATAEKSPRAVDVSAFISLFTAEWCPTEEQQADASRRLDAFFHPGSARPSCQAAQRSPFAVAAEASLDPHTWLPPDAPQEELQRWREDKLLLPDRLAWRRRQASRR